MGTRGLTGWPRGVTVWRMSTQDERPTTRRVAEIVAAAGPSGILAVDVANHFITDPGHRQYMQSWVDSLLSRQLHEGKARRTKHRERPAPGSAHRASYRWWITGKGLEYVNPEPEPDITPLPEPPNPRRVLEILEQAGDKGATGPVIGRHFTLDYGNYTSLDHSSNLQRRINWANQILQRFWRRGYAERGNKEPSPYYNHVPAYRWFITDKGREYLAGGMAAGRKARRVAAAREKVERNAARRRRADELITQAYVDYDENTPVCVRNEAIRRLRDAGCTLASIGGVFDLTRERVRQIQAGIVPGRCRCPKHDRDYSGLGWPS